MSLPNDPKISFGIIVLNGEPFTKYCLRQLYPHAHQIIVVEGGSLKAINEAPNGHSTDGTLEALREFKTKEDPADKVQIVTRDRFWSEKDEQSQAYAQLAEGDYLWQVDIDEFYHHADIERVRQLLRKQPLIDTLSFRQITFWGAPSYYVDSFYLRAENASQYHRLFRWQKNFRYLAHRPPTVTDDHGVDLRSKRWLDARATERLGIRLYHYSLLFPHQVINKASYYSQPGQNPTKGHLAGSDRWARECYLQLRHPFRVHNYYSRISWLRRYLGNHPEEIQHLWSDIGCGRLVVQLRETADVEHLLSKRSYMLAANLLTVWSNIWRFPALNFVWRAILALQARAQRATTSLVRLRSSRE
jgi:glycosyltransferase involved in cell wall biosynthesis